MGLTRRAADFASLRSLAADAAVRCVELLSSELQSSVVHPELTPILSLSVAAPRPSPREPEASTVASACACSSSEALAVHPGLIPDTLRVSPTPSGGSLRSGLHQSRPLRRASALVVNTSTFSRSSAPGRAAQSTGLPDPSDPPCPHSGAAAQPHSSLLRP